MTLLARALYHNDAEAPNELTFRKGEILTVINRTPQGLTGWWICNVRGKIGLAPGNRLQLLGVVQPTPEMRAEANSATYDDPASVYDTLPSPSPSENRRLTNSDHPQPPGFADEASEGKRCPSVHSEAASQADSVYQVPEEEPEYQIPAPENESVYSVPPDHGDNCEESLYQVPPDHDYLDASHSNRSSGISSMSPGGPCGPSKETLATTPDSQFEDYEVAPPPRSSRPISTASGASSASTRRPSDYCNIGLASEPNSVRSSATSLRSGDFTDLPALPDQRLSLSRDTALQLLDKVKGSTETNSARLFKFISARWKSVNSLVVNGAAIRTTCEALASDIDEFIRFAYAVLAGANASPDPALPRKVWKHLKPLEENQRSLRGALAALNAINWRPEEMARLCAVPESDYLNQIVTSVRSISIDMRSLSVTTSGNSTVLFPEKVKANPVPEPSRMTAPAVDWAATTDDMDYLEMSTKRLSLQSQTLSREEKESLRWYSAQLESGVDILNQATDSLFKSIEKSQPPNVYVQHSKFVVMSAQKLVYVGDSLGRALKQRALAQAVMSTASEVCEQLKAVVATTKTAAQQHPSPVAIQTMMDAVVKVSASSSRLHLIVANSANAS